LICMAAAEVPIVLTIGHSNPHMEAFLNFCECTRQRVSMYVDLRRNLTDTIPSIDGSVSRLRMPKERLRPITRLNVVHSQKFKERLPMCGSNVMVNTMGTSAAAIHNQVLVLSLASETVSRGSKLAAVTSFH